MHDYITRLNKGIAHRRGLRCRGKKLTNPASNQFSVLYCIGNLTVLSCQSQMLDSASFRKPGNNAKYVKFNPCTFRPMSVGVMVVLQLSWYLMMGVITKREAGYPAGISEEFEGEQESDMNSNWDAIHDLQVGTESQMSVPSIGLA
jgi:hypothetical protein